MTDAGSAICTLARSSLGARVGSGRVETENRERLEQLRADADGGVERLAGILVDDRGRAGAQVAQLVGAERQHIATVEVHAATEDAGVARQVANGRVRRGRFTTAALADQPVGLARLHREGNAAQHLAGNAARRRRRGVGPGTRARGCSSVDDPLDRVGNEIDRHDE